MATAKLSNGVTLMEIGSQLRAERDRLGLSLSDVETASGVSRSMISAIERGAKVPSIVVLDQITTALGTSLAALVQPPSEGRSVVLRRSEQLVDEDPGGWHRRILSPRVAGVDLEFMRTTIAPGVDAGTWIPHGPGTHEYLAVESGALVLTVDGRERVLEEGDSIYYDANCAHGYANRGTIDCVYYLVFYRDASTRGGGHQ